MATLMHVPCFSLVFSSLALVVGGISMPGLPPTQSSPTAASPDSVAAASQANGNVHLVRLRRREARHASSDSKPKSFYTARIFIGNPPQAVNVAFDTASGSVILPSTQCVTSACLEHKRYRPQESDTAAEVNADGSKLMSDSRDAIRIGFSSLDLGDGSVTGHLLSDTVCLPASLNSVHGRNGSDACAEVGLVAAASLSDTPFLAAPYDGILGLGMEGLAIHKAFSYIAQIGAGLAHANATISRPSQQQFALYHGSKFGEAAFGGYNPKRLVSPLAWVPVTNPAEGYWQVQILSVRLGSRTLEACKDGNCRGIIDSGTSSIGIPAAVTPSFDAALASSTLSRASGAGHCVGEDLHFELSGSVVLTLRAADYASGDACKPKVTSLDLPAAFAGVFIIGGPILSRYYTVFDRAEEKIGFGLAAARGADGEEDAVAAAEAAEDVAEAEELAAAGVPEEPQNVLLVLLQALALRVMVVMSLIYFGTHISTQGTLFIYFDKLMNSKRLQIEMAQFAPVVPSSEVPEADECVICLGSFEDELDATTEEACNVEAGKSPCASASEKAGCIRWRRLSCGHHFHEHCIHEWLQKTKQCPTCRRPLVDTSLEDPVRH